MNDHGRHPHTELGRDLARRLEERDERSSRAHAAAAEVTGLPAAERPGFVRSHPDCLATEFIELMIAIARERRGPAPEESVAYAHLAAAAAEAAHAAGAEVAEPRALAFAELGNAHRICGDLRRAGIAFQLARERVRFVADPLVRAEVDSLEASYLDYCNEFAAAERLLRRAERLEQRYGSGHGVSKIRIQRGSAAQRQGEPDRAIELIRSALLLVDHDQDPRLAMVAIHNLANALIDADRPDEALSLLRRHREALDRAGSAIERARLGWLEGRAARRAGLDQLAEAALEEVRDRFIELEKPYDAALVFLDLSEIYLLSRRWAAMEEAAAATLALSRACGAGPEALAAAGLYLAAVQGRQGSAETLSALAAKVRRTLDCRTLPRLRTPY
jgi:tetratricopeptide (TPR) repeat protein